MAAFIVEGVFPAMRVVCAWCGVEMKAGSGPASHGICRPCQAAVLFDAAPFDDDGQRFARPFAGTAASDCRPVGTEPGPARLIYRKII